MKIIIDVSDEARELLSNPEAIYQELTLSPDFLYEQARPLIPHLLHLDSSDKTALLMKTAVKGIFIMYGEKILEQIFKSKDHPRPAKGDDIVEWYISLFTQLLIIQASKSDYTVEANEQAEIIRFSSQPIPAAPKAIGDGTLSSTIE